MSALEQTNATIKLLIDGNGFGDFSDLEYYRAHFKKLEVRYINYSQLFSGVQHTKILIGDQKSFYVGSSNLDWRALTEVKEIGLYVKGETETAEIYSYFQQLWVLGTKERNESAAETQKTASK